LLLYFAIELLVEKCFSLSFGFGKYTAVAHPEKSNSGPGTLEKILPSFMPAIKNENTFYLRN